MDKKSKEALRRYKKARPASSSDSSSSSDSDSGSSSDSYSSSSSKKKSGRRKKVRRHSSSSSDDDRARKREKHACHKKLEAKRNHLKKKLREAKAKKRAVSPSMRRRSVTPPHKVKKVVDPSGEKKHHRMSSKERIIREREREREKIRLRERERGRSRSPKSAKILRTHPEMKRKSPMVGRHQLSPREKIIIQARRDRSPVERKQQRELKIRHDSRERDRRDRERVDRDAARTKEREEALARCQERQRERERLAREKMRREKSYERGSDLRPDRLLPRPAEREMAIAVARGFGSRERSLEPDPRERHPHPHASRREPGYEREREFDGVEHHRGGGPGSLERGERRGELDRDYLMVRRRELDSPGPGVLYPERVRGGERELYSENERAPYPRGYDSGPDSMRPRERSWDRGEHDMRREHEHGKLYPLERPGPLSGPGSGPRDWKTGPSIGGGDQWHGGEHVPWEEKNWQRNKKPPAADEPDWDAKEKYPPGPAQNWDESLPPQRGKHDGHVRIEGHPPPVQGGHVPHGAPGVGGRRWAPEWRGGAHPMPDSNIHPAPHRHPGPHQGNFRHNQHAPGPQNQHPGDYVHEPRPNYRHHHPPPLIQHHSGSGTAGGPIGYHHPRPHFPSKRQMTYTNPNLLKNKQMAAVPQVTPLPTTSLQTNLTQSTLSVAAVTSVPATATSPKPALTETSATAAENTEDSKVAESAADPPDEGEIVTPTEKTDDGQPAAETVTAAEEVIPDDLSEISDGEDEILEKEEEKFQESSSNAEGSAEKESVNAVDKSGNSQGEDGEIKEDVVIEDSQKDEDDLLDFEEISDGELEEDARIKGVGDALGVDWASLVEEAKVQENGMDVIHTGKQKWQPHRIFLDVGISFKYAGEEFARQLIADAKQKFEEETEAKNFPIEKKIKLEKKDEDDIQPETQSIKEEASVDIVHPLACVQVAERLANEERKNLIFNACGPNSRALSARRDLRLRRKLCALPIKEAIYPQPVSDHMKALALQAFQRAIEAK